MKNIYYIDDDINDYILVRDTIEEVNIIHHDGGEGLDDFCSRSGQYSTNPPPDLYVIDVNLTNKTAFDIVDKIRDSDNDTAIAICSGAPMSRQVEQQEESYKNKSIFSYFMKPLSNGHVRQIFEILGRRNVKR